MAVASCLSCVLVLQGSASPPSIRQLGYCGCAWLGLLVGLLDLSQTASNMHRKVARDKFVSTSIHHRHHHYQSLEGIVTDLRGASSAHHSCRLQKCQRLRMVHKILHFFYTIYLNIADHFDLHHCRCCTVRLGNSVPSSGEIWAGWKTCWQEHKKVSDADILILCCLTACQEGPQ